MSCADVNKIVCCLEMILYYSTCKIKSFSALLMK